MKITSTFVLAAVLAGFSSVSANDFEPRSVSCSNMASTISAVSGGPATAASFCRIYLGLGARTVTSTITSVRGTRTITQAAYTTTVLSITPDTQTALKTQRSTTLVTSVPASRTVTQTVTSTAYVANDGETIGIERRDSYPTHLAARAQAIPAFYKGLSRSDLVSACQCLNLARTTATKKVTLGVYATATKALNRKLIKTTTLAAPLTTQTILNVVTKVITAAAPATTTSVVEFQDAAGCPPSTSTAFLCPAGTGDDNGADPNYETCEVEAADGFSGYCLYWADDGSPADAELTLGDGSGDSANDETRAASYGNDDTDDCPSWADWTCAPSGQSKRSFFEMEVQKRAIKTTVAAKKTTLAAKKPKKTKKVKAHGALKSIPYPPPARGGAYVPYVAKSVSA